MEEQGYRFGVGVLVVASMVIAVILILFFGAAPNLFKEQYVVTIRFDAAPGVETDTPVRKNGVRIGRVKSIQLLNNSDLLGSARTGGVDLTLELDSEYQVQAGEQAQIGIGSFITSEAVVEFREPTKESVLERFDGVGGSPANGILDQIELTAAQEFMKDGDFFAGGSRAPDPLDALVNMQGAVASTLTSFQTASDQISELTIEVREMLGGGDGELKRITQQASITIENLNRTLLSVNQLVSDPNLKKTMDTVAQRLPELINRADQVMLQVDSTVASFEGVGRAAEAAIQNVSEFTEPFGEQGDEIVGDLRRTINNLDNLLTGSQAAVAEVNNLAIRFRNGQGTLAKLIDDDQLYYSLLNTLDNVETITRRVQPIIEDARVASDKISRNPGVILREAFSGSRGGIK